MIIFLTHDLIFSSQVAATAQTLGVPLTVAAAAEAVLQRIAVEPVELLLLDLTTPGFEPLALMQRLPSDANGPHIVAYAPHVQEAKLQAARDAGIPTVLTRGQFHRQFPEILARR